MTTYITEAKYFESDDILLVKYKGYTAKLMIDLGDPAFGEFIAAAINEKVASLSSLPSDSEIEKAAEEKFPSISNRAINKGEGFIEGAKWLRSQLNTGTSQNIKP